MESQQGKDKRMKKLLLLAILTGLLITGCDKRTPDQIYESANQAVQAKNIDAALKEFGLIVKKYPEYAAVPKIMFQMAELQMNEKKDLDAGINAFRQLADKYPDTGYGPKGRFMAGFLLANTANRLDEARKEYELFLKSYPDNDLVEAVKFELENLGKPIEDIPQLKGIISPGKANNNINVEVSTH